MAMSAGTAVGYLTLDVSQFASGMATAVSVAQNAFSSMGGAASSGVTALGATMSAVGGYLTQNVTKPVLDLGANIFEVGQKFDATMDQVAAVSRKPGQSLLDLQQNTQMLREEALRLGSSTFYSAQEVADGMVIMSKAGWDAQDIMDGMGGVLDSASASGEDLSTVSTVLVDSLTAFGLSASHATDIADLFAQSANAGTLDIKDLGNSMKYAGPVASALGMSVTDTAAAITMMSKAGIKGSQAGTALRRILLNMTNPTEKQAEAMERLGISVDDGTGHFKSLQQILRDVRSGVKNFDGSTVELQANLQKLAGAYGISGLNAILNLSDQEFEQIIHDMEYSGGVAKTTAQIMRDNVAGAWDEFKDKVEAAKIKVFDAMAPSLEALLDNLNKFVDNITNKLTPGMIRFGVQVAAVLAALGPLLKVLGSVVTTAGLLGVGFDDAAKSAGVAAKAASTLGKNSEKVSSALGTLGSVSSKAFGGMKSKFVDWAKSAEEAGESTEKTFRKIGDFGSRAAKDMSGAASASTKMADTIGNSMRTVVQETDAATDGFRNFGPRLANEFDKSVSVAAPAMERSLIQNVGGALTNASDEIAESFSTALGTSIANGISGVADATIVQAVSGSLVPKANTALSRASLDLANTFSQGFKQNLLEGMIDVSNTAVVTPVYDNLLPAAAGALAGASSSLATTFTRGMNQNLLEGMVDVTDTAVVTPIYDRLLPAATTALGDVGDSSVQAFSGALAPIGSQVIPGFAAEWADDVIDITDSAIVSPLETHMLPGVVSVLDDVDEKFATSAAAIGGSVGTVNGFIGQGTSRIAGYFEHAGVNFVDLGEKVKEVPPVFEGVFGAIRSAGNSWVQTVTTWWETVGHTEVIHAALDGLKTGFTALANVTKVVLGAGVLAVIAALVAAFIHLMNTNEEFATAVTEAGSRIHTAFVDIGASVTSIVSYFRPIIDQFQQAFGSFAIATLETFKSILDSVASSFEGLASSFTNGSMDAAVNNLGALLQGLATTFETLLGAAESALSGIAALFSGDIEGAISSFGDALSGIGDAFTSLVDTVGNFVGVSLANLADGFRSVGLDGIAYLVDVIANAFANAGSVIDDFKQRVAELAARAAPVFERLASSVVGAFNQIAPAIAAVAAIVGGVLLAAFENAFSIIGGLAINLASVLSGAFSIIGAVVGQVVDTIGTAVTVIGSVLSGIYHVISAVFALITGDFDSASAHWGAAVGDFQNVISAFGSFFENTFGRLGSVLSGFGDILGGILGGIGDVVGGVAGFIGDSVGNIAEFFGVGGQSASDMADRVEDASARSTTSFGQWAAEAQVDAETAGGSFEDVRKEVMGIKRDSSDMASGVTESLNGLVNSATETASSFGEACNNMVAGFVEAKANIVDSNGNIIASFEDMAAAVQDTTGNAASNILQTATSTGASLQSANGEVILSADELRQAIADMSNSASNNLNSMSDSGQSALDRLKSLMGDAGDASFDLADVTGNNLSDMGLDWSQYATGVEGDTGVATASFEEMGASIDAFGNKSKEAAESVSTAFQSVSDSITNSLTGATEQFTQFGTSSSEAFLSITDTVNNFVTSSQASFESFKLSASTVFDTLLTAVQNFSSQASVSLDTFVASISTSFTNAQTSVINFTLITSAALQQFNTSATATFTSLSTDIANAFLSLTTQVLASFQSLTNGITAQLTAAQLAVEGWVNVVTSSVSQVVASVSGMSAELNTIAASWGTQFVATVTTSMNAAAAAMSTSLNQMASNMSSQTNSMLSTVRSNFNSMTSTVNAQTSQMASAISSFGSKASSEINSACSRMKSAVSSQFSSMVSVVQSQTNQMVSSIQNFGNRMVSVGTQSMSRYKTAIQQGFEQTKAAVNNASNQMVSILTQLVARFAQQGTAAGNSYKSSITGALGGLYGQLYSIGSYAIQGMAAGIASGSGAVVGAIRSVAAQAVAAAQAALKISSPSKVMRDKVGVWIPAGIAQGIENNSKAVFNAFNDLKDGLMELAQDAGRDWAKEGKAQVKKFSESIKQALKSEQTKIKRAWKIHYEQELKIIEDEEAALNKEISDIKAAHADSASKEEIAEMTAAQNARLEELKSQKEELKDLYKSFGDEVLDVFNNAMQEISEGVSEELANKFQSIADTAAKALEDVQKKIESMTTKLKDYGELFTLEKKGNKGVELVKLSDLQKQINAIEHYGQNLDMLKGKVSDTLMSEIVAMDVDKATKYTDYLLKMSDEALEQYNSLYEEKQRKAAEIATKFYQDKVEQIKDEYLKQLVDAFLASYDEIDGVTADTINKFHQLLSEQDWSADAKELLGELAPLLSKALGSVYEETSKKLVEGAQELAQTGSDIVKESGQGIKITVSGVVKDVIDILTGAGKQASDAMSDSGTEIGENFAGNIITSAKDELGIHSPSKVFESLGEDTGAGFVQGIVKILSSDSPFEQFAEVTKAGLDVVVNQLSTVGAEHILPIVKDIVDKISKFVNDLVNGILDLNDMLIKEFEKSFKSFNEFMSSTASSISSCAESIVSSYNSMAAAARDAASAVSEAAAAFSAQAAAQAEASRTQAEANNLAVSTANATGSRLTTQSVTNNYSTVINSPVKVSAIEAMRTSARTQRSMAEGF